MPNKSLPDRPSLGHLKHQALDLHRALKAKFPEAIQRVREFHPKYKGSPVHQLTESSYTLSDAQVVLAREYGFGSWAKLKHHVEALLPLPGPASNPASNLSATELASKVNQFLHFACPDHHIRGGHAHLMARGAATQWLRRFPQIAQYSLITAVVCGDLATVRSILKNRPSAATEIPLGSNPSRSKAGNSEDVFEDMGLMPWDPLLYLCFTRLPLQSVTDNAVAIAQLLLDHGANPNAYFMAGDSRYTTLTGLVGEGEECRPAHPQRDALIKLLLSRGAEPYDIQVIYNLHFNGSVLWFLKLIYERSQQIGRRKDWEDPEWRMLSMGNYGTGARWHLEIAIKKNDIELAEWALTHGANPNSPPAKDPRFPQSSLYEEALKRGCSEISEILIRFGATTPKQNPTTPEDLFWASCLRLEESEARRFIESHPQALSNPCPLMLAAESDRVDVMQLLLRLGFSPEMKDPRNGNQRVLHICAWADAWRVAEFLIAQGVEVDPVEIHYQATPLGFAVWGGKTKTIEVLSQHSRSVPNLALLGKVERLRQILQEEPGLSNVRSTKGETPLMSLPGDDEQALEVVQLLLHHGADPTIRNSQGHTAEELARKRGLLTAADAIAQVTQSRVGRK